MLLFAVAASCQLASRADKLAACRYENAWPERVEGFGLDMESARKDALRQAQREIALSLERLEPPITAWRPSEEFIVRHVIVEERAGSDVPLESGSAKRWLLQLRPPDLTAFYRLEDHRQKRDRLDRQGQRLSLIGRILASASIFLAVGSACRRWQGKETARRPCRRKATV
jgi:hypothetical protein